MDSDHTAARSGRVHRPFRFRSVQVGHIKSNGREEREQAAQPVEYDHGGYALLRFRGATYAERFFISQPFTTSLAVSARALIGCAAGRTKHLISSPYQLKATDCFADPGPENSLRGSGAEVLRRQL